MAAESGEHTNAQDRVNAPVGRRESHRLPTFTEDTDGPELRDYQRRMERAKDGDVHDR